MLLLITFYKKTKTSSLSINKCPRKIKRVSNKSAYVSKAIVLKRNNVYDIARMSFFSPILINNRELYYIMLFKNDTHKKPLQSTVILLRHHGESDIQRFFGHNSRNSWYVFIGSQISKALIMYTYTNYYMVIHRSKIKNIYRMLISFCYKNIIFTLNSLSRNKNSPQLKRISNSVRNTLTHPNIVKSNVFFNNFSITKSNIKLHPSILGSSYICSSTSITKKSSVNLLNKSFFSTCVIAHNPNTKRTVLLKLFRRTVVKRSMMSASCVNAARASYYFLHAITNPTVLNTITPTNKRPLTNGLVNYALDDHQGIIQHKYAISKHCITERFPGPHFYQEFSTQTGIPYVTCENAPTDVRVLPELPVIEIIHGHYGKDIEGMHGHLDSTRTERSTFAGQHQTNYDWSTTVTTLIKTAWNGVHVTRCKTLYHDEKSGTGMFKHSSSGSLGILYYDSNGNNIQVMSNTYSMQDLIEHQLKNNNALRDGLDYDQIGNGLSAILLDGKTILLDTSILSLEERYYKYQRYLWDHVQRNPNYNRNISFIFIKTIPVTPMDEKLNNFQKEFNALLEQKLYNLDKRGDCRAITIAMISAYAKTVDPKIHEKLRYLQHDIKVEFNHKFLEDLARLLKTNVFFT